MCIRDSTAVTGWCGQARATGTSPARITAGSTGPTACSCTQDPDDFDGGSPCGRVSLVEVPCDTWGGFVWYTMDPDAPSLAEFLDPIPELFANRDLGAAIRVLRRTFAVDANWKFASDNFNESYHLPTVHPELGTTTDEDYRNTIFEAYSTGHNRICLLYTSPSPRDQRGSRMPSSA